jgi:hypothetical protein
MRRSGVPVDVGTGADRKPAGMKSKSAGGGAAGIESESERGGTTSKTAGTPENATHEHTTHGRSFTEVGGNRNFSIKGLAARGGIFLCFPSSRRAAEPPEPRQGFSFVFPYRGFTLSCYIAAALRSAVADGRWGRRWWNGVTGRRRPRVGYGNASEAAGQGSLPASAA